MWLFVFLPTHLLIVLTVGAKSCCWLYVITQWILEVKTCSGSNNEDGWLTVGVTVWYCDVFCVSGDDTYAYRIWFMYVHVGGGAWIVNIPGGTIESPGNAFHQEGIVNDSTKFRHNPTNWCGDMKYLNSKQRHPVVICQNFAQSLWGSWGSSHLGFMSFGQTNVEVCNTLCFEQKCTGSCCLITWVLFGIS